MTMCVTLCIIVFLKLYLKFCIKISFYMYIYCYSATVIINQRRLDRSTYIPLPAGQCNNAWIRDGVTLQHDYMHVSST